MILLDSNIKNIADVRFTCVPFGNYEVPFFSNNVCVPDTVLSSDALHFRSPRERYYVFFKLHTSLATNVRIGVFTKDGVPVVTRKTPSQLGGTSQGFNTYYASISPIAETLHNNEPLELILYNNLWNVLAKSPIIVRPSRTWDRYLTFNYYNLAGDTLGFPFNAFKSTGLPDAGTQNMGLTYTVPGGVQIGSTRYGVDETSFRDQRYVPHTLSANTNKLMTLSIGDANGVPEYVGEIINDILSCDTVFVNGRRIRRSEGSVPEPKVISKEYPFVHFSVDVEVIPTNPDIYNISTLLGLD